MAFYSIIKYTLPIIKFKLEIQNNPKFKLYDLYLIFEKISCYKKITLNC